MFAVNDVEKILLVAGEDSKSSFDYTLPELHQFVNQAVGQPILERSFRRILSGLGVSKNENGYYSPPDAIMVIGWLKHRHKYSSYREYRQREGKRLYQQAQEIDFTNQEAN